MLSKPEWCQYWAPMTDDAPAALLYKAWWGNEMVIQDHDVVVTSADGSSDVVGETEVPQTCPTIFLESFGAYEPPGTILVRDDYTITLDYLTKIWAMGMNGIVVHGQPGIGKTFFLWYLLRHRLGKKLPTVFQLGAASPHFFHESGVYQDRGRRLFVGELGSSASIAVGDEDRDPPAVWYLVDMLNASGGPGGSVWPDNVFSVQTVSENEDKFRGWAEQKSTTSWIMNPWTWSELVSGLALRHPDCAPVNLARLQGYYDKYGPVPRIVFEAYVHGVNFTKVLDGKVDGIIQDLDVTDLWHLARSFSSSISEYIVCRRRVRSTYGDEDDQPPTTYIAVLSRVVMYKIVTASRLSTVEEKRKICGALAGIDPEGTSRRWCFASFAHVYLCSESLDPAKALHLLHPLAPMSTRSTQYSRSPRRRDRHFTLAQHPTYVYDSSEELAASGPQEDHYHIPSNSENPSFDSFLISGNTAYIFQTAVSKEHQIDTDLRGLRALKSVLKHFPSVKWHYILVVPEAIAKINPTLSAVGPEWAQAVSSFSLMVLDMKMPSVARGFWALE